MKHTFLSLLLFTVVFSECNVGKSQSELNKLITSDLPKFLSVLPTLSHNDMKSAFNQTNMVLRYDISKNPAIADHIEAYSRVKIGNSDLDGQMTLLATKLLPHSDSNEYAITLMAYPSPINDTILQIAKKLLTKYERKDLNNVPTWKINDWLLQIKGKNIVSYFAISDKSIYDLMGK